MREIVLDTETTGLSVKHNKIIEIGAIEIVDGVETGNYFHSYLNPQMAISPASQKICGITDDIVKDAAIFQDIADELLDFIGDSPIVAHNARFDISFLNKELNLINLEPLKNPVVDTLKIARSLFKNNNSLDALCKRFKISLSTRMAQGHGALLDSQLLVKVLYYLRNTASYSLQDYMSSQSQNKQTYKIAPNTPIYGKLARCTDSENKKHIEFCKKNNIIFNWGSID